MIDMSIFNLKEKQPTATKEDLQGKVDELLSQVASLTEQVAILNLKEPEPIPENESEVIPNEN